MTRFFIPPRHDAFFFPSHSAPIVQTTVTTTTYSMPRPCYQSMTTIFQTSQAVYETTYYGGGHRYPSFSNIVPVFATVPVAHSFHVKSDKEREEDRRAAAGVLGVIIMGIASFVLGSLIFSYQELNKQSQQYETLRTEAEKISTALENQGVPDDIVDNINVLIATPGEIMARNRKDIIHKIAITVFFLLAGLTLVAGAITGLPIVLGIGAAATVGAICWGLFRYGLNNTDAQNDESAKKMEASLNYLSTRLSYSQ